MKNKFSDARTQNLIHEARLKSSHIENEIESAEDELTTMRSKKASLALEKSELIRASKEFKLLEKELDLAKLKIYELTEKLRLQSVEIASLHGKKLVNSKGKLESQEIEESKQFRDLLDKLNQTSEKYEALQGEVKMKKRNHDELAKEIVRVLKSTLADSTATPSRREFLSRKIEKLTNGDIATLPSILIDLTY